jgi:ATP-dependent DNA helicase RecG
VLIEEKNVLLFETDWSAEAHQLADGRYVLRVDDKNIPFAAGDIESLKEGKRRRVTEIRFIPDGKISDLDLTLVSRLAEGQGVQETPEETLIRYRLAEGRNGRTVLTLAALLLFGKNPGRWHPHCDIDVVKYEGTSRKKGATLNVVKRERLEAPLVLLIENAYRALKPHIRERQRLVDLFFEEKMEYPSFAWQEAIVNAVAHRDYGLEGLGIEIWLFDDRMEIRSPGCLVEPVTLDRLLKRERIHSSRNPRIVRVLTDFGYMREQGEGIPRMFEVMEREGLNPPEILLDAGAIFTVILKNSIIYNTETLRWLNGLSAYGLNTSQKRILAFAKERRGAFTSREFQELIGVDIYTASREIKDLIRKRLVLLPRKGGRTYEIQSEPSTDQRVIEPPEFITLKPVLKKKGYVRNEDIRNAFGISDSRAKRIARRLVLEGWLNPEGKNRARKYLPAR